MTKIAILSDIHGNMHALRAVIADLDNVNPDRIIINGDSVGRGPDSAAVVDEIWAHGWESTRGNHEAHWLHLKDGNLPDDWDSDWWTPTRTQLEAMDASCFSWMKSLPKNIIIDEAGSPEVCITHGSPSGLSIGLYADMDEHSLLEVVGEVPYGVIVGAHTHVGMERHAGPYHILNSSSVGAPFNGDPRAQYLLLHSEDGAWRAEFRNVSYNRQAALQYWHDSGYFDSGAAARIFAYELETSTFHFWHYVRFCDGFGLDRTTSVALEQYRAVFPEYMEYCKANNLAINEMANIIAYSELRANPV